jgi:hypothetical protein
MQCGRDSLSRKFVAVLLVLVLGGLFVIVGRVQRVQAATVDITLYGSAGGGYYGGGQGGWGFTSASISSPGPAISVNQYDYVNLTLFSYDSNAHRFYVDYNNDSVVDAGEPVTSSFSSSIVFGFNASVSGTFTYRCAFHPSVMYGMFTVNPAVPEFSPILAMPLFTLVTLVAVLAHRRKRLT